MIHFFGNESTTVFAVQTQDKLSAETISKLNWLFQSELVSDSQTNKPKSVLADFFVGPRATMITPWSTNAVEITQNMGVSGIIRIEEFQKATADFSDFDPMLSQKYSELNQDIFTIHIQPEPILEIDNIADSQTISGEDVGEGIDGFKTKVDIKMA
jgi:phosphoribosylformylglycinamidine synthase